MFALRSRAAFRRTRAPLETLTSLQRQRPVTARAAFSTSVDVRKPDLEFIEEESNSGARIPLSIQANYYEPLRRTAHYGLRVCDLQLRSYSVRNLEFMCDFAMRAAYYAGLPASGPIPLPRKIERWTVPRGNFVHKKSQENFERITLKRLIQIKDGSPETVELWLAFLRKHQYHGVGMKANVWSWDEIGVGRKMNVSLETLRDDIPRPKWAHFGPRKTSDTASMAQQILNSPEYRALEETPESLPDAEAAARPVVTEQQSERSVAEAAAEPEQRPEQSVAEAAAEPVVMEQQPEQPVTEAAARPVDTAEPVVREQQPQQSMAQTAVDAPKVAAEPTVAQEKPRSIFPESISEDLARELAAAEEGLEPVVSEELEQLTADADLVAAEVNPDPVSSQPGSETGKTTLDVPEIATAPAVAEVRVEPVGPGPTSESLVAELTTESVPVEKVAAIKVQTEPTPMPVEEVVAADETAEPVEEQEPEVIAIETEVMPSAEELEAAAIIAAAAGESTPKAAVEQSAPVERPEDAKASRKNQVLQEEPEEEAPEAKSEGPPSAGDLEAARVNAAAFRTSEPAVIELLEEGKVAGETDENVLEEPAETRASKVKVVAPTVEPQEVKAPDPATVKETNGSERVEAPTPSTEISGVYEKANEIVASTEEAAVVGKALDTAKREQPENVKAAQGVGGPAGETVKVAEKLVTASDVAVQGIAEQEAGSGKPEEPSRKIEEETRSPTPGKK